MPISCHFRDCKALLVTSSRVSSAIASTRPLPLPFTFMVNRFRLRIRIGVRSVNIVWWSHVDVPSRRSSVVCSTTWWWTSTVRTVNLLLAFSVLTSTARMQDMKCSRCLKQQITSRFDYIRQTHMILRPWSTNTPWAIKSATVIFIVITSANVDRFELSFAAIFWLELQK